MNHEKQWVWTGEKQSTDLTVFIDIKTDGEIAWVFTRFISHSWETRIIFLIQMGCLNETFVIKIMTHWVWNALCILSSVDSISYKAKNVP